MAVLALIGSIYFLFSGLTGKGRAFVSKMGTPLPEKEAKFVKRLYLITGGLLVIVTIVSAVQMFMN